MISHHYNIATRMNVMNYHLTTDTHSNQVEGIYPIRHLGSVPRDWDAGEVLKKYIYV